MGTSPFSCAQIDLRKAQERELATLDEKSTSSVRLLNPMRDKKLKTKNWGGVEVTTPVLCDHTACPEAGKYKREMKKKKKCADDMRRAALRRGFSPLLYFAAGATQPMLLG